MDLRSELTAMLRTTIGPLLREHGFRGTAPTWRIVAPNGDVGVVNVQRSRLGSGDHIMLVLNLSIVPAPWWEHLAGGAHGARPAEPSESYGLFRARLARNRRSGPEEWWGIRSGDDVTAVGMDVAARLVETGIPGILHRLDRRVQAREWHRPPRSRDGVHWHPVPMTDAARFFDAP